ncbi:hypothetical protein ABZ318_22425 [Streptomyces sp. NPDC006197]|uniref:hypothetical protein n=1 Tax=Streptomyces sp. NPDC006197 TaxID=3156685 RepID=UPI0033BACB0B
MPPHFGAGHGAFPSGPLRADGSAAGTQSLPARSGTPSPAATLVLDEAAAALTALEHESPDSATDLIPSTCISDGYGQPKTLASVPPT